MRLILSRSLARSVPVTTAMAHRAELTECIRKAALRSWRRCSGGRSIAPHIRHDECSSFIAPTPWIHRTGGVSLTSGMGEGSGKIDFHRDEGRQTGNMSAATNEVAMRAISCDRNVM